MAAILAAAVAGIGVFFQRKSGRESAGAAKKSAEAADESAKAARESVNVNRNTSVGVAQRAHADALAKRYHDAATQLGHDRAPVRLAGVYAMALLADDWPERRQMCLDVMCSYLRMPPMRSDGTNEDEGDQQVRTSIQSLVRQHLRPGASPSWSDSTFDFTHATLRGFDMRDAVFKTRPNMANSSFVGWCSFNNATFDAGITLSNTTIDCQFEFTPAVLSGEVNLWDAAITQIGRLSITQDKLASGSYVLKHIRVCGILTVRLDGTGPDVPQETISMENALIDGGTVRVNVATRSAPTTTLALNASGWTIKGDAVVNVTARTGDGAKPSGGSVNWNLAWR